MPRFPAKEDKIVDLAQQIYIGLRDNFAIWPDPPVATGLINVRRIIYQSRYRHLIAKRAQVAAAYTVQQNAMDDLITAMKQNLRYAENTVDFDDHKLKLIGWSAKHAARRPAKPGQVRLLKIDHKPDGQTKLIWQPPLDGGKVDACKIERRQAEENSKWRHIMTSLDQQASLGNQPRGEYLEYRVRAINMTGSGMASNTVSVKF